MFGFVDQEVATAAGDGHTTAVQQYLDANPHQLNNRTLFQSNLLHIAARKGQAAVAEDLLRRGISVDALDFGGMRRTALHWACQGGHVRIVELLLEHGADTKVQGKAWNKLVQGKRCGRFIDTGEACEDSPTSVCSNNLVRLALERPTWTPETNHMYPEKFKDVVRLLLLAQHSTRRGGMADGAPGQCQLLTPAYVGSCWPLDWDSCREILALAAYPISTWL